MRDNITETADSTKAHNNEKEICGYISKFNINGKIYKLRAEITEVYPMNCTKCGAPMELHHGEGKCDHCGTSFTTMYKVVET